MTNRPEDDKVVKKVFFGLLDVMPAEEIKTTTLLFEKMYTVEKMVGDQVWLRLDPQLGGDTFTLKASWQTFYDSDYGVSHEFLWNQFPKNIQDRFADFVNERMPGAFTVGRVPEPREMKALLDAASKVGTNAVEHGNGQVTIAGKFFTVSGFLLALTINISFKLLYRLLLDRKSITVKNVCGDVASGTAACCAVYATKLVLCAAFMAPPVTLLIGVSGVAAYYASYGAKRLLGVEEDDKKDK